MPSPERMSSIGSVAGAVCLVLAACLASPVRAASVASLELRPAQPGQRAGEVELRARPLAASTLGAPAILRGKVPGSIDLSSLPAGVWQIESPPTVGGFGSSRRRSRFPETWRSRSSPPARWPSQAGGFPKSRPQPRACGSAPATAVPKGNGRVPSKGPASFASSRQLGSMPRSSPRATPRCGCGLARSAWTRRGPRAMSSGSEAPR